MSFLLKTTSSRFVFILLLLTAAACNNNNKNETPVPADTYIIPPAGFVSEADSIKYGNAVQAFYYTTLLKRGFNGAMLVAKNGKIIFEKYNGFYHLEKKDTLTEHSAFHLASVSKTFTAMAILKLVEQGKLQLDDNINTFFPGFPYNDITLRTLLNHRSGLPNYLYFMETLGWDKKTFCTNKDVLNYLMNFQPPMAYLPNRHFNYCNTNYTLLALIIEKISGKTYASFLKDIFFTPLKMQDTYVFSLADTSTAMPSYNWKGQREVYTHLDAAYGDKNIYSTARDLLKWDQALYNNQLFTKKTIEEAFTPYSNERPGIKNYGFGWRMNIYPNGKKMIFHGGWWHGNNTMLMRLIEDSVTIIILGNRFNRNVYKAKDMANVFSTYFETDEEENDSIK